MELLALKALLGGAVVVAFALIAEVLTPKKFAGLFAAAPSVALGSLLIIAQDKGPAEAGQAAGGMVAGGVGMLAFCMLAVPAIARLGATLGSVVSLGAWAVVAIGLYVVVLR